MSPVKVGESLINDVYQQFVSACKEHLPKDPAVCTWKTFLEIDGCEDEETWNGCPDSGAELCEAPEAPETDDSDSNETTDECENQTLLQAECLDSMIVKLTRES